MILDAPSFSQQRPPFRNFAERVPPKVLKPMSPAIQTVNNGPSCPTVFETLFHGQHTRRAAGLGHTVCNRFQTRIPVILISDTFPSKALRATVRAQSLLGSRCSARFGALRKVVVAGRF